MTGIDKAIAALRDWNSRRGQVSGSLASLRIYDAEGAKHARTILAALDTARGQAVAWRAPNWAFGGEWQYDDEPFVGPDGSPSPHNQPLFAAPPAAVPDGMVMAQRADLAALEATDFGRCGWSARADLAARRLRDGLLASNKENGNG